MCTRLLPNPTLTTEQVRDWIVPVNRRYNLKQLTSCLAELHPADVPNGSTVLIEYLMLRGINDTSADAARLLQLLKPIACKVNLIQFNAHDGTRFAPSTTDNVKAFRAALIAGGRVCTVRDSRGDDEMAACGQLGDAADGLAFRRSPQLQPPARLAHLVTAAS